MIRNLIFDMGNVLIHWDPPRFMERMGLPEEDRALLLTEVFGSVEWIQTDRGTLSFEDGLKEMCARLPERLHRAARELTLDWWKDNLLPVEGMAELVRELKGLGYNIYLLSNAKLDLHQYFDRIPGSECFDGMIVSADWKLLKPQPELYHVLLQEYGLKAEECFFTDDLNINIEAAVLVGMSGTVFRGAAGLRRTLTEAGVPVKAAD
jgi:putative hydrolase of the HAD superfamily